MNVKDLVQKKYAEAARRVSQGEGVPADCCAATGCCSGMAAATWRQVFLRMMRKQRGTSRSPVRWT